MEVQALRFNELYTSYDNYLNSIYENITTFNYGFLLNSDVENIRSNYDSTIKYVTTLIYNYYYEYYLTSASEDTFKRLHTMSMVSKLPYFKSLIDTYNNLINTNLDKTNGQENNATSNGEISRSGNSRQATTPQDLSNTDYIDDYSSSQQKYSHSATDTRANTFTSNNTGSISDTFKHIEDIPKRIFNEVISLFGKYFFSSDKLTPYTEQTIEESITKLNKNVIDLDLRIFTLDSKVTQNETNFTDFSNKTSEQFTEVDSQLDNINSSITDINSRLNTFETSFEDLVKVTPTDLKQVNNKLYLYHDTTEISNQTPVDFKTIGGTSIFGSGDISVVSMDLFMSQLEDVQTYLSKRFAEVSFFYAPSCNNVLDIGTNMSINHVNVSSIDNIEDFVIKLKINNITSDGNSDLLFNGENTTGSASGTIFLRPVRIGETSQFNSSNNKVCILFKGETLVNLNRKREMWLYTYYNTSTNDFVITSEWYITENEIAEI